MIGTPDWTLYTLLGPNSPFIGEEHWNVMRRSMTERDYRRVVLAEDLPSESRLYHTFDRKFNLKPIPFGAKKITSLIIGKKIGGTNWGVGLGHDPGTAKAATIWADAYDLPRLAAESLGVPPGDYAWFIREELFTTSKTPEEHALAALQKTRDVFGCNLGRHSPKAHVRCQPLGSAEDKPGTSTLKVWNRVGFDIRVSEYSKTGRSVGQIKKDDRIAVVCALFCNAYGHRRMFLECDEHGTPKTPLLLSALETAERDHRGRAETEAKNVIHDKSDLPSALGYWVWVFEREAASALRADIRQAM
jgi:hypothetical protein